jgi:hypothetical protein
LALCPPGIVVRSERGSTQLHRDGDRKCGVCYHDWVCGVAIFDCAGWEESPRAHADRRRLSWRSHGAQLGRCTESGGRFHRCIRQIGPPRHEGVYTVSHKEISVGVEHEVEWCKARGKIGR